VKKNSEEVVLNLIALDKNGRKFTNCTSIDVTFDLKGAGILQYSPSPKSYQGIKNYVQAHKDLLDLK